MATKIEKQAIKKLLYELETARAWFDDTAYPRQSRRSFEEALVEVKAAFGVEPPNNGFHQTGGSRRTRVGFKIGVINYRASR